VGQEEDRHQTVCEGRVVWTAGRWRFSSGVWLPVEDRSGQPSHPRAADGAVADELDRLVCPG